MAAIMNPDMDGKTCLITGGSDGIGYAAALELAHLAARVVIAGRNADKTEAAAERIRRETGNTAVSCLLADLSSQREVRRLADEVKELLPRLDVLLNNAGAIFLSHRTSVDGIEMTFALNHLGYFLLTTLLLDLLTESAPARIINVSSSSHYSADSLRLEDLPRPGDGRSYQAYGRSKLCNLLFTYELARRMTGSGVTVNALHPGLVRTSIARNNGILGRIANLFIGVRGVDSTRGAETPVYLASSPDVATVTGKFFIDCREVSSSQLSYDADLAAKLWELSERLTDAAAGEG
jgi:NAD(P)-dependent dehydrogenase (short-subunit alcohol dehydrogenase family)